MKVYKTNLGYTAEYKDATGTIFVNGHNLVSVTMSGIKSAFNNSEV